MKTTRPIARSRSCSSNFFIPRRWHIDSLPCVHSHSSPGHPNCRDPRLEELGPVIEDEYATIQQKYGESNSAWGTYLQLTNTIATPRHAIVLAHGLLGFDEIQLGGPFLPAIEYWHGIKEALSVKGIHVITASVSASGSIQQRARELERYIAAGARGKDVNIIAYGVSPF